MEEEKQTAMKLFQGKENSLIIETVKHAAESNSFLKESYTQAVRALREYLVQTDEIRDRIRDHAYSTSEINNILYQSPQNIFAFSGTRGTGKTSAMLSFTESLGSEEDLSEIGIDKKVRRFNTINPIDPTMLEPHQNILNIVLSRLLFKAQEAWNDAYRSRGSESRLTEDKDSILRKASGCLSEIRAVKSAEPVRDLDQLQKTGDSAILKKDLYELVELLNRFCFPSDKEKKNILVIPIDDTDCQIVEGYRVMEDIRRYLTLPNVVILMATDIDMLRQVFTQSFADQFGINLSRNVTDIEQVMGYADKYMAKMIPPTYKFYLPLVDDVLKSDVKLEFMAKGSDGKDTDILGKQTEFQAKVLCFIYRKTHLVFIRHENYTNSIIPQTLRGLSHFLNYLYMLDDIPKTEQDAVPSPECLKKMEKNLYSFESYFLREWVPSKLHKEMRGLVTGIADQPPESRVRFAFEKMRELYKMNGLSADTVTYADLDQQMREILGTEQGKTQTTDAKVHGSRENHLNMFAVRTILDILNLQDAVKEQQKFYGSKAVGTGVFPDYESGCPSLPDAFYMNERELPSFAGARGARKPLADRKKDYKLVSSAFTAGIFETLRGHLGTGVSAEAGFLQQETALVLACSWEAQDLMRKTIARHNLRTKKNQEKPYSTFDAGIRAEFGGILEALGAANEGMLSALTEAVRKEAERKDGNVLRCDAAAAALKALTAPRKRQTASDQKKNSGKTRGSAASLNSREGETKEEEQKDLTGLTRELYDTCPPQKDRQEKMRGKLSEIASVLNKSATADEETNRKIRKLARESIDFAFRDKENHLRKDAYEKLVKDLRGLAEQLGARADS